MQNHTSSHIIAALAAPKKTGPLITYANNVVASLTGNASFASLAPTLPSITKAVAELQAAENVVLTRVRGAVTIRDQKRAALVVLLRQVRLAVQQVADAHPEEATTLIQSAGLSVKRPPVRANRTFAARAAAAAGSVKLVARSEGKRASYEWSYSVDGGKTWTAAPVTLRASTVVTGLPSGTTVQFRYRAVTAAGEGAFSAVVSLTVP